MTCFAFYFFGCACYICFQIKKNPCQHFISFGLKLTSRIYDINLLHSSITRGVRVEKPISFFQVSKAITFLTNIFKTKISTALRALKSIMSKKSKTRNFRFSKIKKNIRRLWKTNNRTL